MNYSSPIERTTQRPSATIAWSALETNVCSDRTFPDHAFCLELIVLNGERHIYRLKRDALTELFDRIAKLLGKGATGKEAARQSQPTK